MWRGVNLDGRTAAMMDEAAALSGPIYLNPTQGSYSSSVGASAGTHSGCGAVDLMHPSWSVADYDTVVAVMRRVGFAAWHRTPAQSDWPRHVHGIAVQPGGKHDPGCLHASALGQVQDYYDGRNGLASGAADDGPRHHVGTTWETYQEDDVTQDDIKAIADLVDKKLGDYALDGDERHGLDGLRGNDRLRQVEIIARRLEDTADRIETVVRRIEDES